MLLRFSNILKKVTEKVIFSSLKSPFLVSCDHLLNTLSVIFHQMLTAAAV